MALENHTWKLVGVSPLLQNNPAATMGGSTPDGVTTAKKKYDDKQEAEIRTIRNSKGQVVHPSAAVRSGLLEAAKGRKIGKTAARVVIAGSVFPADPFIMILDGSGKPIKDYEIYKCRVVVNKNGILRCRPMFSPWSANVELQIDRDFITDLDLVTTILNVSGRIIGLGDFRPDTSKGKSGVGTFGRFAAQLVK